MSTTPAKMTKSEQKKPNELGNLLNEREKVHGNFRHVAITAQRFKGFCSDKNYRSYLNSIQVEAIDMICSKLARILHGNAAHKDHWIDIAGYAMLVANTMEGPNDNPPST